MGVEKALRLRTATGLYLGSGAVVCTTVAQTPMGSREVFSETIPLDDCTLTECIATLVEEKKLSGSIVCGVGSRRFYLITRSPPPLDGDMDIEDALAGGLARMPGGLVSATTPVRLPGKSMLTLQAMSGDVARDAIDGLGGIKEKRLLLTGVPLALYQAARADPKPSRKLATEVRVFLNGTEGMAVLAFSGTPIALHMFECPADSQVNALVHMTRNLEARARDTLGLSGLDVVYLHVGLESAELASITQATSHVKTMAAPEVGIDRHSASVALATLGLKGRPKGFRNLFDKVFEPAGFVKNFPIIAVMFLVSLLGAAVFTFSHSRSTLVTEAKALKKKARANLESVGVLRENLKAKHASLKEEFRLANYFITDRAYWGEILRDFPDLIPDTMTVEDLDARDKVLFPRKKQRSETVVAKLRKLSMAGITPVADGVQSPPELGRLTTAIETCASFQDLLPRITNSNVKMVPGVEKQMARILITTSP
jgi:hypothetical protein